MSDPALRPVRVWDLPTRAFHWSLATSVLISWASGQAGRMELHFVSGYVVLALVLFRIAWGFAGSTHARFVDFVHGPAAALGHVRALLGPGRPHELGHNPLGGWMILALLLLLLGQVATGLLADDDIALTGPLGGWVSYETRRLLTSWHHLGEKALLALVVLHVAAVLAYRALKGIDLIGPMVSGVKRAPVEPAGRVWAPTGRAIAFAAAAAVAVWALIALGGRPA